MTISKEAVMRREVGARGPQDVNGIAARAAKLYNSGFYRAFCQQAIAMAAANFLKLRRTRFLFHSSQFWRYSRLL
jgi:hypothetical protein